MRDKPLCDRLRANGSPLTLEAAEAISQMAVHAITLEAEAATWRQMLTQSKAENAKLREALTPSAETKAAYMSEVVLETISDDDEDGLPVAVTRYVPWTAIKDTMKLIRARALKGDR